jgi:hypothetical protein
MTGSRAAKLDLRLGEDFLAEVAADGAWGVKVDFLPEEFREFGLDREEREARNMSRVEVDEDVHGARRSEVLAEDGSEKGEPPNMVTATEVGEAIPVDPKSRSHGSSSRRVYSP